jgi:hypothetical protein
LSGSGHVVDVRSDASRASFWEKCEEKRKKEEKKKCAKFLKIPQKYLLSFSAVFGKKKRKKKAQKCF